MCALFSWRHKNNYSHEKMSRHYFDAARLLWSQEKKKWFEVAIFCSLWLQINLFNGQVNEHALVRDHKKDPKWGSRGNGSHPSTNEENEIGLVFCFSAHNKAPSASDKVSKPPRGLVCQSDSQLANLEGQPEFLKAGKEADEMKQWSKKTSAHNNCSHSVSAKTWETSSGSCYIAAVQLCYSSSQRHEGESSCKDVADKLCSTTVIWVHTYNLLWNMHILT